MGNTIQELKAQIESANNQMLDIQSKFAELQENNVGLVIDWPFLRKVFLLGAYHATCSTERYIKDETHDLEHELDEYTSGNSYITIQGSVNIEGSDIAEHLRTPAKGDESNHKEQMTDLLGFAEADIDVLVEKHIGQLSQRFEHSCGHQQKPKKNA